MLCKVTGAGHSVCVCVCVCRGGVRGSEFNGAWGKREEGVGERWERVELPDSLMYEAVLQSAGPRLETPQSPP